MFTSHYGAQTILDLSNQLFDIFDDEDSAYQPSDTSFVASDDYAITGVMSLSSPVAAHTHNSIHATDRGNDCDSDCGSDHDSDHGSDYDYDRDSDFKTDGSNKFTGDTKSNELDQDCESFNKSNDYGDLNESFLSDQSTDKPAHGTNDSWG